MMVVVFSKSTASTSKFATWDEARDYVDNVKLYGGAETATLYFLPAEMPLYDALDVISRNKARKLETIIAGEVT